MGENLQHFGLWLDKEFDKELIEFLRPYADKRRIGELFRNALSVYRGQPAAAPVARPVQMSLPMPSKPELDTPMPMLSGATGDTSSAKEKVRHAFGVRRG